MWLKISSFLLHFHLPLFGINLTTFCWNNNKTKWWKLCNLQRSQLTTNLSKNPTDEWDIKFHIYVYSIHLLALGRTRAPIFFATRKIRQTTRNWDFYLVSGVSCVDFESTKIIPPTTRELWRGSEILTSSTLSGLFSFINTCQLELFFSLFQLQKNKCENLSRTIYLTSFSCSLFLVVILLLSMPSLLDCRHRSSEQRLSLLLLYLSARWHEEVERWNENKKNFTWSNIKLCWKVGRFVGSEKCETSTFLSWTRLLVL